MQVGVAEDTGERVAGQFSDQIRYHISRIHNDKDSGLLTVCLTSGSPCLYHIKTGYWIGLSSGISLGLVRLMLSGCPSSNVMSTVAILAEVTPK